MYVYITNTIKKKNHICLEKMRTGSLSFLLVRKRLRVSVSRGEPSIDFLMNIGYTLRPSRRVPSSSSSSDRPSVRPVVHPVVVVRPLSIRPRPSLGLPRVLDDLRLLIRLDHLFLSLRCLGSLDLIARPYPTFGL